MTTTDQGPFDISQIDRNDGVDRIDLGAMLVPATEGVDLQVQVDENSGNVVLATASVAGGGVQLQPYAAPKSGGMWDEIRPQIMASISSGNGLVEQVQGPFGIELHAQIPGGDGKGGLQPARFVGVDGPRWFLRAVFLGAAARPGEVANRLDAVTTGVVVIRGDEAMPVGTPIPLRLPNMPTQAPAMDDGRPPIAPFERGPEITETR